MDHKVKEGEVLINVNINNPVIIEALTEWSTFLHDRYDDISRYISISRHEPSYQRGLEHDYMEEIRAKGSQHDGFPEMDYMFNIRPDFLQGRYRREQEVARELAEEITARYHKMNDTMITELGIRRNALSALYPPNGYIGWHNNANASSYNLIFTYSATGDGYWEHVNPYTNQIERIEDVKGWQCKATYFGAYSENNPKSLIYHTAACGPTGFRATVSWIFDRVNKDWWLDSIEEIESD